MNSIKTPDAAEKLRERLGEMTSQKIEHFEVGQYLSLPNGGLSLDIDVHLDGEKRRLMATEIDGRVDIVDRRFGLAPGDLNEHYDRLDTAQRQGHRVGLLQVEEDVRAGVAPARDLDANGWPTPELTGKAAQSVNRIDTPDAADHLRNTLEEMTRQPVEDFKLGEPNKLANGGMTRELTATVGGTTQNYHAVEIGGQVSIVQQGLGVSPEQGHTLLNKTLGTPDNAASAGNATNNGWPTRTTTAERTANQLSQVRARRR